MQKKHLVIDLLRAHLFKSQLQPNSSIRIHSFLKSAPLSFSKKLRSKLNTMVYFFLLDLKNRIVLLTKYVKRSFIYNIDALTHSFEKQLVFYIIPEFHVSLICRQTIYFFIKRCKSFLDFYKIRLHIYCIFWNLLFSVAVEQCNNIALPKTRSFKTVLRSPHIDKRSREQFEKIEHRSLMLLPSYLGDLASVVNYVVPTFGIQVTQHMTLKR